MPTKFITGTVFNNCDTIERNNQSYLQMYTEELISAIIIIIRIYNLLYFHRQMQNIIGGIIVIVIDKAKYNCKIVLTTTFY